MKFWDFSDQMVLVKTTTIGMMLGLLKPSNGEIIIDGKKIEENRIEILKNKFYLSLY